MEYQFVHKLPAFVMWLGLCVGCQPAAAPKQPPQPQREQKHTTAAQPKHVLALTGNFYGDANTDSCFLLYPSDTASWKLLVAAGNSTYRQVIEPAMLGNVHFQNWSWVFAMQQVPKGQLVFPNVMDDEIISDDLVPDSLKVILPYDGIHLSDEESGSGGILYFSPAKGWRWAQLDG